MSKGKDPAMLWYWSDWYSGTATMSRFLKGCYIDVLHAQFNSGPLSLEEIKTVLGSDFGQSWPTIQKKFIKTSNGLFFNARLKLEKEKRENFINTRGGRKGITKDHVKIISNSNEYSHEIHTVNRNLNKNKTKKKGVQGGKETNIPTLVEFLDYCKDTMPQGLDYNRLKPAIELKYAAWKEAKWHDGNGEPIKVWKSKILNTIPHLKPVESSNTTSSGQNMTVETKKTTIRR